MASSLMLAPFCLQALHADTSRLIMQNTTLRLYEQPSPSDMSNLAPGKMLNDVVINAYLRLLERRSVMEEYLPKVWAVDNFFLCSLRKRGYRGVRKASLGIEIPRIELMLIPAFVGNPECGHWYLICVDFQRSSISAYDSIEGRDHQADLEAVKGYLIGLQKMLGLKERRWEMWGGRTCAKQKNNVDCGVFLSTFAEAVSRRQEIKNLVVQEVDFRRRMVQELQEGKIRPLFKRPTVPPPRRDMNHLLREAEEWSLEEVMQDEVFKPVPPLLSPPQSPGSPGEEDFQEMTLDAVPDEILECAVGPVPVTTVEEGKSAPPARPTTLSLPPCEELKMDESPVLSLSPGWSFGSASPSSFEDVLPRAEETQKEEKAPPQTPTYAQCHNQPGTSKPVVNVQLGSANTSKSKKKRRGKRRKAMKVEIPGTGEIRRVNINKLGLIATHP